MTVYWNLDAAIPFWLQAHCHEEQVGQSATNKSKKSQREQYVRIWSGCVVGEHSKALPFIKLGCV